MEFGDPTPGSPEAYLWVFSGPTLYLYNSYYDRLQPEKTTTISAAFSGIDSLLY